MDTRTGKLWYRESKLDNFVEFVTIIATANYTNIITLSEDLKLSDKLLFSYFYHIFTPF